MRVDLFYLTPGFAPLTFPLSVNGEGDLGGEVK